MKTRLFERDSGGDTLLTLFSIYYIEANEKTCHMLQRASVMQTTITRTTPSLLYDSSITN